MQHVLRQFNGMKDIVTWGGGNNNCVRFHVDIELSDEGVIVFIANNN